MRLHNTERPKRPGTLPFRMIAFFSLWTSIGLAQVRPAEPFTLAGQLAQPVKGNVYVLNQDDKRVYSAPIQGTRFTLKGKLAEPGLYRVQIDTNSRTYAVFLEGAPMQMTTQKNGAYQVTGSKLHSEWRAYTAFTDSTRNKLIGLSQARSVATQKGDTVLLNQLWAENTMISLTYGSRMADLIAQKPHTFFNLFLLKGSGYADDHLVNMLNEFKPTLGTYPTFQLYDQELKTRADNRQKVAIGQEAYDFTLPDSTGATHSLASVRTANKLVLVDFWASWCGPCIKEFPGMTKLHAKYASQGLEIIGISTDKEPKRWLSALSSLRPSGLQLHLTEPSPLRDKYAIYAIPQTFLIDQNGVIRGHNLTEAELDKKVAELLAETR